MDLFVANLQVDKVSNKSFESTAILSSMSGPITSLNRFTRTLPSSIASPVGKFSAEAIEFVGCLDLCEFQEIVWKTDSLLDVPNSRPDK